MRSLLAVDAQQDPALNELLRVAAHALRCPMAMISLVDSQSQWPWGCFGMPHSGGVMAQALCAETVRYQDVRVVTDATLDPAMASHPMVTGEPGVRFYAGIALRVDGHRIGTLCLLDRLPRTLDADGRALLTDLAHAIELWLVGRREQAQLAEREQEFRVLTEQMPGVVYRMSPDSELVPQYVSPQVRALGYTPEQWTQAPGVWLSAIHPDDLDRVLDEQVLGLARGEPFEMQYRLQTGSGQWLQVRDVVRIIRPSDGASPVIHGVILDRGQQVVMRDRHELILRAMPDGVLVLDDLGVIVEANPKAQQMLGLSPAALLGRPPPALFSDDALPSRPGGDTVRWCYAHPDGGVCHLEATVGAPLRGLQVLVLRDVSSRHEEEAWLRKLSQAADQASEAIVITDLRADIEYVNQAALTSSGYAREELIGCNSRILQSGLTPESRYRKLWSTLTAGRVWRGFFNNRRKDGSHYIEFAVISPVVGPDGRVTHYLAVKEDITAKRRMGEDLQRYRHHLDELVAQRTSALEKARGAAESASAAKSAFLAAMSHEIRTPMNGVVGLADVLQRTELTPHQHDLVDTLRESAQALLNVIDDILDFSKIEAGKLVLEPAPMSLRRMVEKAADALQPVAASRAVHLHAFVDPSLPETIVGDAGRLRQIVINLVGNAIKFSAGLERGGRVALRLLPHGLDRLCLKVEDNGIGMSRDVQQRVFQPFVQGEVSTSHYGGTGLGLVITQRLVDAMQGAIEVHSEPDRGAVFCVYLPLVATGGDSPETARDGRELAGLNVWLALEDSAVAEDWARYLQAAGAQVGCTRPGSDLQPGPGSVVVCEPQFMNLWPRQTLVAMHSVLVRHEPRSAPRQVYPGLVELDCAGLHRDDLLQAVAMAAGRPLSLSGRAPAPVPLPLSLAPAPQDSDPAAPDRCILVAEDNEINQVVIRQLLALLGLRAEPVSNGQEALARWRADRDRYSLVLTDLHMPLLDGFALTEAIRQDEAARPGGARVPVIALTANVAGADAGRCKRAGMDDFLSKPVQVERLRETLQQWLRGPVEPPLPRAGCAEAVQEVVRELARPDFDDAVLQRLVGSDTEVLADLRQRYLKSLDTAVSEIAVHVQSGSWQAAGLTAHRLKSSSCALGALRLGWIFESMETAGREGDGVRVQALAGDLVAAAAAASRHYRWAPGQGGAQACPCVLCVDDDASQLAWLERQLRAMGIPRPETFDSGGRLLERLAGGTTDAMLLLVDLNMPRMDGVDLIRQLGRLRFAGMLVLLGRTDTRVVEAAGQLARAHGLRTLGHLLKPLQEESLRLTLERWPQMAALRRAQTADPQR